MLFFVLFFFLDQALAMSTRTCCQLYAIGGGAVAGAVLIGAAVPAAVGAAGFGAAGPVAGGIAAGIQGPAVAAGGWFATFQGIGMAGVGGQTVGLGGMGGGMAGAVFVPFCDALVEKGLCASDDEWKNQKQ